MGYEPVPGEVDMYKGSLYTIESKKQINTKLSKVSIANGLAWDMKINKFYYIDSPTRKVDVYDFDIKTGAMCK